jgi:hypothetical protein
MAAESSDLSTVLPGLCQQINGQTLKLKIKWKSTSREASSGCLLLPAATSS